MANLTLYSVDAVIILDSQGKRILSKYYNVDIQKPKDQKDFEKNLFDKTKKQPKAEVILYDNHLVLYQAPLDAHSHPDVYIYVVGSQDENELLLKSALDTFCRALENTLKTTALDKNSIMNSYDSVVLCLDETIDRGVILETNADTVTSRAKPAPSSDTVDFNDSESPLFEFAKKAGQSYLNKFLKG